MNIYIRVSSLMLLFALIFPFFQQTIERTAFREGINVSHFERFDCRIYSPKTVSNISCQVKYIDRNNLRVRFAMVLSKPVKAAWIHGIFYFKYLTYQKIATVNCDDLCAWVSGKKTSFFLDYLKPIIIKYSNFNHTCPYMGRAFVETNNISAQAFVIPQIVPAGRYKLDFNITEGDRRTPLFGFTLYGNISDHRIEVV